MNTKIQELVDKISSLEQELVDELKEQEKNLVYRIEGARIKFEAAARESHLQLRQKLIPWLKSSSWRSVLSAPIIYPMIVPIAFLDLSMSFYQSICFRLYGIARVKRADYVVIDRHYLDYLNVVEKINCVYCGYANGVVAYTREIISLTEQYWCPIKHARRARGAHPRQRTFLNYGAAEDYHVKVLKFREKLSGHEEKNSESNQNK